MRDRRVDEGYAPMFRRYGILDDGIETLHICGKGRVP